MISDQLITALCHTLLHSLWQGILLAAVAGGIIIATRKTSPSIRYNLLISALMLFAVGVLVTFAGQLQGAERVATRQPIGVHGVYLAGTTSEGPQQVQQPGVVELIESYLNDHRNTIILVWFLVICARSLQLGFGLYGTYRIRRIHVFAVEAQWRDRMQQLAAGLGITQTVALLESGLAKAPMMIGHLKPVILVPVGLLTALPAEAIEAILIHELAHIKRRDYLVNLLQSGMEIVFFFNPAVLWISTLIRTERENCCDDLAVAQHHNKANYIRALVSCEEYKAAVPPYAMAFPGGKHSLLHRVKRMADNRNHSLNLFEKTMLAVCVVCAGLFMMAFSTRHAQAKGEQPAKIQPAAIQAARPRPVYTPPVYTQPVYTQPVYTQPVYTQPVYTAPAHAQSAVSQEVQKPAFDQQQKGPGNGPMKAKLNIGELNINGVNESEAVRALIYSKFLNDTVHGVDVDPYQAYPAYHPDPAAYQRDHNAYRNQQEKYAADERAIKIDLIREGLVSDTNHIQFTLSDKEFILNGTPQAREIFQRYRDRYVPANTTGWGWTHGTNR